MQKDPAKKFRQMKWLGGPFFLLFSTAFGLLLTLSYLGILKPHHSGDAQLNIFEYCAGMLFVALFFTAGISLFRDGSRKIKLIDAHPDQPWLHRQDWVDHEVRYSERPEAIALFFISAFLSLIFLPLLIQQVSMENRSVPKTLVFLVFISIATICIGIASKKWRCYRYWKTTTLQFEDFPLVLGKSNRVSICPARFVVERMVINLTIQCNEIISHGKTSTTKLLWNEKFAIEIQKSDHAPIQLALPADQKPMSESGKTSIAWSLVAESKNHDPAFRAIFELPVISADLMNT